VHAVDERVARDDRQMRARRLPRGRVVADADRDGARRGAGRDRRFANIAERLDERVFGERRARR